MKCIAEGSKKIYLHKLNEVAKDTSNKEKSCAWQLKVNDLQMLVCVFTVLIIAKVWPIRL